MFTNIEYTTNFCHRYWRCIYLYFILGTMWFSGLCQQFCIINQKPIICSNYILKCFFFFEIKIYLFCVLVFSWGPRNKSSLFPRELFRIWSQLYTLVISSINFISISSMNSSYNIVYHHNLLFLSAPLKFKNAFSCLRVVIL